MKKKLLGNCIGNAFVITVLLICFFDLFVQKASASMMFNSNFSFPFSYENQELNNYSDRRSKLIDNDPAYIQCTFAEFSTAYFYAYFGYEDDFYNEINYSDPVTLSYGEQRWVETDAYSGTYGFFKGKLIYNGYNGDDYGCIFEGRWRPDSAIID